MYSNTKRTNSRPGNAGSRGAGRAGARAWQLLAARLGRSTSLALLLFILFVLSAGAMDRADLGRIIKVIPPNGPFWKYGNVEMHSKTRKVGMAPVVFAHWSHRARYTCRVCHQQLGFSMRAGDTGITRSQYLAGKYCGACHNGTIAFGVAEGPNPQCKKCHMENTKALQREFALFTETLPMAPFGNGIDWTAALNDGRIRPTNVVSASDASLQLPDKLRTPLKLGTASPRSDVGFSHQDHFVELDCSSCHPDVFSIKRKSTVDFTMESNLFAHYCGVCHMQVAFPMNDCRRCHKSMSNESF